MDTVIKVMMPNNTDSTQGNDTSCNNHGAV